MVVTNRTFIPFLSGIICILLLWRGILPAQELSVPSPALLPSAGSSPFSMDLSLDGMVAVGGSTAKEERTIELQGGAHDPKIRGFTLQQGELSALGAVDPYFFGEGHFIFFHDPYNGESGLEVEELFFRTLALPMDLELKGGLFLTEFGLKNPQHPHAWAWLDQPIVLTRVFGGEGMRQVGGRLSWLAPLPFYLEFQLGAQNARGETMASFLGMEASEAGDSHSHGAGGNAATDAEATESLPPLRTLVYTGRMIAGGDLGEESSFKAGLSYAFGSNPLGDHGRTQIFGADGKYFYRPLTHHRGFPFLSVVGEMVVRVVTPGGGERFLDRGGYVEALYGFRRPYALGFRWERVLGDQIPEIAQGAIHRTRISPLLIIQPTEFSRIRLQYNLDLLSEDEEKGSFHTFWAGVEFLFGRHPAHIF